MSDTFSNYENYKELIRSGVPADEAMRATGLTDQTLADLGYLTSEPLSDEAYEEISDAATQGARFAEATGVINEKEADSPGWLNFFKESLQGLDITQEYEYENTDKGSSFIEGLGGAIKDTALLGLQTTGMLHQIGTHLIDPTTTVEEAMPSWLRDDDTNHEYVSFLEAVARESINDITRTVPAITWAFSPVGKGARPPTAQEVQEMYPGDMFSWTDEAPESVTDAPWYARAIVGTNMSTGKVPELLTKDGLYKTQHYGTEFILDMFSDPVTYATMGTFSKLWSWGRKLESVSGIRAAALKDMGLRTGSITTMKEAQEALRSAGRRVEKLLGKNKISEEAAARGQANINDDIALLNREIERRVGSDGEHIVANSVPVQRTMRPKDPANIKGLSKEQRGILELERKFYDDNPESVLHMLDMDEEAAAWRMLAGPDQGEVAATGIGVLARNAKRAADVVIEDGVRISPLRSSTNIPVPRATGLDGAVYETGELVRRTHKRATELAKKNAQDIKDLEKQWKALGKDDPAKKPMKKVLDEWRKKHTKYKGAMQALNERGMIDGKLADELAIPMVGGGRRPLTSANNYLEDQFGKHHEKFVRTLLYPGSYAPKPGFLFAAQPLLRISWRFVDKYDPKLGKRFFGAMHKTDMTLAASNERVSKILHNAGLFSKSAEKRVKGAKIAVAGPKIKTKYDKGRALKISQWLDMQDDAARLEFEIASNILPQDIKAAQQIKALFNEYAYIFNFNKEDRISNYVTKALQRTGMSDGQRPFIMDGLKGFRPAILKTRKGNALVEADIVEVMDFYNRAAAHELHMRPLIQDIRWGYHKLAADTGLEVGSAKHRMLINHLESLVNRIEGKPSWFREQYNKYKPFSGGDKVPQVVMASAMFAHSSVLAGTPRYFNMSLAQAINSTVPGEGAFNTLQGAAKMTTKEGQMLGKLAGIDAATSKIYEGVEGVISRIGSDVRFAAPSIRDSENYIRGVTMHASLSHQMQKLGYKTIQEIPSGILEEMMSEAMMQTRNVNHVFGFFGKPMILNNMSRSGSTVATQFTMFPLRQTETIMKNAFKNPGYLADYIMVAGAIANTGHRLGIDLREYVGLPTDSIGTTGKVFSGEELTIPLTFFAATIHSMAVELDPGSTEKDKHEAREEWAKAKENMIPLNLAGDRWSRFGNAVSGKDVVERRKGSSEMRRIRNLHVPGSWRDTEYFAAVTHMSSVQDKIHRGIMDEHRKVEDDLAIKQLKIADEIHEAVLEQRPVNFEKITKLTKYLQDRGLPITITDLQRKIETIQGAASLSELVRETRRNHRTWGAIHKVVGEEASRTDPDRLRPHTGPIPEDLEQEKELSK